MHQYRSFAIWVDAHGVWRGERHGVTVCAQTKEQLQRVIDLHIADKAQWEKERNACDRFESKT